MELHISEQTGRMIDSIGWGIALTIVLFLAAIIGYEHWWGCIFAWNGCYGFNHFGTPKSAHEGRPLDLFGFALGIVLGVPVYSIVIFGILELRNWKRNHYKKTNLK